MGNSLQASNTPIGGKLNLKWHCDMKCEWQMKVPALLL